MTTWSLPQLLAGLHEDIQGRLKKARESFGHPTVKGDASQHIWLDFFKNYLPERYQAVTAHIVDSNGVFSDQIDVVIFDRQYTPFIFNYEKQLIIPAESVYAVFEAKQTINADHVTYARAKVSSVRRLRRTSLPIPHAGGVYPAKPLFHIIGGILAFESDWNPAFGKPLETALTEGCADEQLDLGCVAAHGHFFRNQDSGVYNFGLEGKPATAFLFKLISSLQLSGTVPMIDVEAYARWLTA